MHFRLAICDLPLAQLLHLHGGLDLHHALPHHLLAGTGLASIRLPLSYTEQYFVAKLLTFQLENEFKCIKFVDHHSLS